MKLRDAWLIPARLSMAMDQVAGLSESNNGLCEAVGTLVGDNDETLRAARATKPKVEQQAGTLPCSEKETVGDRLVRLAGGLAPDQ